MGEHTLTEAHRGFLAAHAVDVDLAERLGVRSLVNLEDLTDLGEDWAKFANFPAIAFPWTAPDGRVEIQVRPDGPTVDQSGRPRKYLFRLGMEPVLWAVRPVEGADRIVIVEGTKQALAAASYAPPHVAVYGIAGCRNWMDEGVQIPDLFAAEDREVVVLLDADAARNLDVYQAGENLANALDLVGATKVTFGRLPAGGTAGLDDILGKTPEDKRAGYLARAIDRAKAKPADTKPTAKPKKKTAPDPPPKPSGDRALVVTNGDQLDVINEVSAGMASRFSGTRLFHHGNHISELVTADRKPARLEPVDSGRFGDVLQQAVQTVKEVTGRDGSTSYAPAWPDQKAMAAVLRRVEAFAPLSRLATAPFVREDGTIVTEPGYDPDSEVMLLPDEELAGLEVPEHPSAEEIASARELILSDWLVDFPFETQADRANALALILTPAIRGLVSVVPLAVLDGSRMGVGKGKVLETMLWVYTKRSARLTTGVPEGEELRKRITASLREGQQFIIFDEAHTVEGEALASALTASLWEDRILGVSKTGTFPNTATWAALGNNVNVKGDIKRRAYRISIKPDHDDPENRPADTFVHPNLERWVRENRRELLAAVLTLARGWFAVGCPKMSRPATFGSFIEWESIVGGILEHAGVTGFLVGREEWAKGSSPESDWWAGHFLWLSETFGSEGFTVQDVVAAARKDPEGFQGPPGLLKAYDETLPSKLPYVYRQQKGRPEAGMVLDQIGTAHGKVTRWTLRTESRFSPDSTPAPGGDGGDGGDAYPYVYGSKTAMRSGDGVEGRVRFTQGVGGGDISSISSISSGPAKPPAPAPEPDRSWEANFE